MRLICENDGVYFYEDDYVIHVYLGDKNKRGAEFICASHVDYLDSMADGLTECVHKIFRR